MSTRRCLQLRFGNDDDEACLIGNDDDEATVAAIKQGCSRCWSWWSFEQCDRHIHGIYDYWCCNLLLLRVSAVSVTALVAEMGDDYVCHRRLVRM